MFLPYNTLHKCVEIEYNMYYNMSIYPPHDNQHGLGA